MDNIKRYKSGFVAVIGRPNAGKSTLINRVLGQKIAAVSPRPQTTRLRQLGIHTLPGAQVIFIDLPGFHQPRHKLGERMVAYVLEALEDSDVILWLVDIHEPPQLEDIELVRLILKLPSKTPVILALNKMDLVKDGDVELNQAAFQALLPLSQSIAISSTRGDNIEKLMEMILERLPTGEPYYPDDQVTDFYERNITAEFIREATLNLLRDEIPHGIAVRIDNYEEKSEKLSVIEATIFVEKESHKGIVIGEGGKMLKEIGSQARQEIEQMIDRKLFLSLRVKVQKDWRKNEKVLNSLGY